MTTKKKKIMIIAYSLILLATITLLVCSIIFKTSALSSATGYAILLCVVFQFALVIMTLPQTIAGNFIVALSMSNENVKRNTISQYCSNEFLQSEAFDKLISKKNLIKISKVSKHKGEGSVGKKTYIVKMRDYSKYIIEMERKNKQLDTHNTTSWVVSGVKIEK